MGTPEAAAESSPKQLNNSDALSRLDAGPESKLADSALKLESSSNAEPTKPLAPPPRPAAGGANQGTNTPDFFSQAGGSLSLEPNPFEQSFGGNATAGAPAETPGGGTKLPSVAALTSPQSLIPGSTGSPFNWGGGSLRTGPLSPAMLSGPTGDYFTEPHHMRGSFPTPNESSLRTGLTPGGGGTMFPAPSPGNGQSLFMPNPTPNTLEFQKTAISAAAKRGQHGQTSMPQSQAPSAPSITSQPQDTSAMAPAKSDVKPAGPFDNHDNDAANGLYMLAQGRNGVQAASQFRMNVPSQVPPTSQPHAHPPVAQPIPPQLNTSPQMDSINGNVIGGPSTRGVSEAASQASDENEQARPNTRGKRKAAQPAATNGRQKSDGAQTKYSNKKTKTSAAAPPVGKAEGDDSDSDEKLKQEENTGKQKMTDEEKRKNFLERNRVAALKCRQRKKQWLANLQNKVEIYSAENDQLTAQITTLREEIVNLKTLLLAHKDCPVTQQQGLGTAFMAPTSGIDPGFNAVNPQLNPYGMPGAAMAPNAQVMAGQAVERRFA